jgi:Flp pilus assembly pilin Flp
MNVFFPRLRRSLQRGLICEQGSNLVEVGLIISLVCLVAVAGTRGMAYKVQGAFGQISSNLASIFADSNFGVPDDGGGQNGGNPAAKSSGSGGSGQSNDESRGSDQQSHPTGTGSNSTPEGNGGHASQVPASHGNGGQTDASTAGHGVGR